jgi:hypothetical protein
LKYLFVGISKHFPHSPSFEGFVILHLTNNPVKEGWVKNPEFQLSRNGKYSKS